MRRVELSLPDGVRCEPASTNGVGILVLAGSSGRVDEQRARLFADAGCVAESIRWFGGPGQNNGPWEIPLETFFARINALGDTCDRVFVVGTSFGAEAALLCGVHAGELAGELAGVIAFAPSDVVWAGYDEAGQERSHWMLHGEPIPYLPFDWSKYVDESPPRYRPLYEASRVSNADRVEGATIPVERIQRLLLVAGGDDQVWPSLQQADHIRRRRSAHGLPAGLVAEPDAGHRALLPGEDVVTGGIVMRRGGTEAADRRLGGRAWKAIADLLGPPARPGVADVSGEYQLTPFHRREATNPACSLLSRSRAANSGSPVGMMTSMTTDLAQLAADLDATCRITGDFALRSGSRTNEYFDKYRFEGDPVLLRRVAEAMVALLPRDTTVLGGLELGGVPIATMLGSLTGIPVVFVRKAAKTYGTCRLVEGSDVSGQVVALVEDIVTTGGAVRAAALALRDLGATVHTVVCTIDRSEPGANQLLDVGVTTRTLLTKADLDRSAASSR